MSKLRKLGFTLIELIAVLSIIAIFAAMLAPNVIKKIDRALADSEAVAVENMMNALESYIKETGIIPVVSSSTDAPSWDIAIADELSVPVSKVNTNDTNYARVYVWESNSGGDINPSLDGGAYIQTIDTAQSSILADDEKRPRLMIISALSTPISSQISSGSLATSQFNALWNWDGSGGILGLDEASANSSLKIARLNLSQLFNRVLLNAPASTVTKDIFYSSGNIPANAFTIQDLPAGAVVTEITVTSSRSGGRNPAYLIHTNQTPVTRFIPYSSIGGTKTWRGSYTLGANESIMGRIRNAQGVSSVSLNFSMDVGGTVAHVKLPYDDSPTGIAASSMMELALIKSTKLLLYGPSPNAPITEEIVQMDQNYKYQMTPSEIWE
ncbi:MAG: type II secretion system protein [Nitrospinota bacterium]